MGKIFPIPGTAPTSAGSPGIRKMASKTVASVGSNVDAFAVGYAPASLDEILTLDQCASWLKQPHTVLLEMISSGQLKKLPFPGEPRLHARTVLEQLGVSPSGGGDNEAASVARQKKHGPSSVLQVLQSEDVEATSTKSDAKTPLKPAPRPAKQPPQRSVAKPVVTKRNYTWAGLKVEVNYVTGCLQSTMAEAAVLDVLVANLLRKDNSSN